MGDIADYYFDQMLKEEYENEIMNQRYLDSYNKGNLVWTTRGGDRILIKDMTDEHIKNCMNMLKRSSYNETLITIFETELEKRKQ